MLAIAGAGTPITPRQREAWVSACNVIGVSQQTIAELRNVDPSKLKPADILDARARPYAGVFVSEGLRAASAEPIDEKKREAIGRVANAVGVAPNLVAELEGILAIEKSARANRYRLLASPRTVNKLGTGPLVEAGAHARAFELGQDMGGMPSDLGWKCGCSILAIAAGDGDLSETEMSYFFGVAASMGVPPDGLEAFAKFDAVGARLEDFLDASLRPIARIVLLDAVRVARADGFAQKERALAKRGAKRLGIEESWVDAIDAQLTIEDSLREARVKLLG
jgi:hypothetical protein